MSAVAEAVHDVIWEPQPGPQTWAITCPVEDLFYGGARGGGKTDWIVNDWVQHQEQYGKHASGLLFRRTFEPEMKEIIKRTKELFPRLGASYTKGDKTWTFPNGSMLTLRHMEDESAADSYIGHQYTWIGFDQLERWTSPDPVDKIRGSMRSAHGIPCVFRATGNPGGVGHQWVKDRYIEPARNRPLVPWYDQEKETWRVFIPSKLADNPKLLENDPNYIRRIKASGPKWLVDAWLDGNWDVVPGAYLEDIWDPQVHVVKPFMPPSEWPRWRALDWGFARPFSVGWYTMDFDGRIFRYRELYGWSGKPNKGTRQPAYKVAERIYAAEAAERAAGLSFVKNPADSEIWGGKGVVIAAQEETIAKQFRDKKVEWVPAQKGPGSRILGAQEIVSRLYDETFFVTRNCRHWIRTVPVMMPDEDNIEDVDTDQEDHAWDETRYSLRSRRIKAQKPTAPAGPKPGTFDHLIMMDELQKREEQRAKSLRRLS